MASDVGIDMMGCAANPNDPRCSCYNVMYKDCDLNPDIPGCKEGNEWKNSIVNVIPEGEAFDAQRNMASTEIALRYHCGDDVCGDDKYKPPDYQDLVNVGRCDFQLNMCASDVNVGESVNAKYFRDCSINEVEFQDLDSVYAQDQSVQAILGLRTGENAALIAAKNKRLQLQLRAEQREKQAQLDEAREAGDTERVEKLQEILDSYEDKKESKKRMLFIILAIATLLIIAILNI